MERLFFSQVICLVKCGKTADRIGVLTGGCIRREITEKEEIRDHPQEMEEELVTLMRGGVTDEKTV